MNRIRLLVLSGVLAAISIVLQMSPLSVETPWGMQVDLVAVPWLVASFLTGLPGGIATSAVSSIVIALVSKAGWLGAVMKFSATIPMVVAIGLARLKWKKPPFSVFVAAFVVAVILRCVLMIFVNYYFALPIWMHKTPEELFAVIPLWWIYVPNIIQACVEFGVAWALVFRTKLKGKIE